MNHGENPRSPRCGASAMDLGDGGAQELARAREKKATKKWVVRCAVDVAVAAALLVWLKQWRWSSRNVFASVAAVVGR